MDAMKKAIMKRRMKLAGDIDMEEMKDANLNPDEGSQDDLDIANEESGLAPDVMEGEQPEQGSIKVEVEKELPEEKQGSDEEIINSFFVKDDLGKPGIKGKAAAKIMEALKKLKG